jgi:hypothetical protein
VALRKAKAELSKLDRLVKTKRISRSSLEQRSHGSKHEYPSPG